MTKKDQPIITFLIFFFFCLLLIAILAHFCIPEAKGQTLPMNPVYIDWTVNPVAVYLDLFDTYYQLQRLSAESDTVYLTIDSLAAHKDTLHSRIDSMQTSRDSVFDAYDAAGGESIGTNSEERINLDTEAKKDAIYVHGADAYGIEITTAGWYRVNYDVSVKNSDGIVVVVAYAYLKKYNASWANVAGTRSYCELQASVNSAQSMSATKRIQMAAGDSLCLTIFNSSVTDGIETIANTVRFGIEKLH